VDRILMLRKAAGLSQKDLASKLFVNQTLVSQWERGTTKPGQDLLQTMADIFNVTTDYLLGRSDVASPIPMYDNILNIEKRKIPLLGEIAAGEPIFADEDFECYIEVGAEIKADYALRAKGDSMINARIMDGDIVFIRQQTTVNNGEIAAVLIENEATLKRFYYDGEMITLVSENPAYPPKIIKPSGTVNVRILGKAVAFQSDLK